MTRGSDKTFPKDHAMAVLISRRHASTSGNTYTTPVDATLGPDAQVFGSGPDGGREASFNGQLTYPDPTPDGPWRRAFAVHLPSWCWTLIG